MKKLLYLMLLISSSMFAQKITIKGKLLDEVNSPLPSATVMLLNVTDSSLVNFSLSDAQGFFELKSVTRNTYLLRVNYLGFTTLTKRVEPTATDIVVELGDLKMEQQNNQLDEVVIKAEKAPVVIKKDTIEFNAPSFKTTENANVEDLLKKLPGVEVDNDGSIRAQGEDVERVTVDGKEFFGRDPKLATRNLPAKAIDKVQIFDKKSDQATFTGIDDGQRDKTINLELKEEFKNGYFGNSSLGYGTDDRYNGKLSLNRFRKNQQLSFLAMGNNINEQGFSIDDYLNFSGTSQQMMGGRGGGMRLTFNAGGGGNQGGAQVNFGNRINGIMSNYAGGVNFNQDFSPKTILTSSYFYNQLEHDLSQSLNRETIFPNPEQNTNFEQDSRQISTNYNHRINAVLDQKIDSANSIKITTTFTNSYSEADQTSTSATQNVNGDLLNESDRTTYFSQSTNNLNTSALLRHRFAKKGRTISSNLSFGYSQTDNEGLLDASNTYYGSETVERSDRQKSNQSTDNTSLGASLSYTEPLGNRRYLEGSYSFSENINKVNREVFDIENEILTFNDSLSIRYTSDYQYHRPGANFKINRDKYSVTVGTALQITQLKGDFLSQEETINRSYQNWVPSAHFNYDFSNTKHLNIDYETSVQEPSITELQPVINNSDPLNLSLGNPALRPAYQHSVRTNFVAFSPASFINFFALINATHTRNAITYAQNITNQGVRVTQPINVASNSSVSANLSLGLPIKKINSRFNFSLNSNQQFGVNVLNDVESDIWQNTVSSALRYNYSYKEIASLDLTSNISRVSTDYQFASQSDQLYFNNSYEAELKLSVLKSYEFTSGFEYLIYNSKTTDFRQELPLLDLAISRFILKNKSGEIKASVNNLLDKNFGVSQTANSNYIERNTTNNLGRYYMLTFTYALNKQLNPMQQRRGSGGIRVIRG
jgi:Outer membrane protein beta-barrel family/CarboxypepD_reg-like domain